MPKGVEVRLLSRALMNIRKFSLNDIEQILEMSRASFAEPWPKSEFEKYLDGSFVAEGDGKIAGFIVGKVREGKGILKLVAVNPDFRGKGVGKELMEYIFQYFAENGAKEIMAHSRLHNKTGCSFLKSFGFEKTEMIKNYYRDGEDAYLMVKKLDG